MLAVEAAGDIDDDDDRPKTAEEEEEARKEAQRKAEIVPITFN